MICVGLIYAAFCIWYAKVPSDMIITNSNDMIKMSIPVSYTHLTLPTNSRV